jgi:hypothetical protein
MGEAVLRKRCKRYVVPIQALSVKFYQQPNKGNGEALAAEVVHAGERKLT